MLYSVNISANTWHFNIEANSEEEAIWKALDFFRECEPDIYVEEREEEPSDIDDDCGFDPYEGCYTYDC